ncbi:SpoIIE family protein phosphatase [Streptomyces sp. 7R007]
MAAVSAHRRHPVAAEEDVGALRRSVARLAATRPDLRPGAAELVATELGTNLLRHAHPGGYVLVRPTDDGIELLSVDGGPGMTGVALPRAAPVPGTASGAGASTATPSPPARGAGLNAGLQVVRRYAAEFDWYATRRGTVVYARLGSAAAGRRLFGGVNVPLGGSGESGDAWAVVDGEPFAALVVDGLGHGSGAAVAARAAVGAFVREPVTDLDRFVRRAHEEMRATRGGVLGACLIDAGRGELAYAAVGNITGRVYGQGRSVALLDRPGTLGTQLPVPHTRLQCCPWQPGSLLVLVSDGIRTGWNLDDHPRLAERHPAVVAAVVHREFGRPTDDATVLVVREPGSVS